MPISYGHGTPEQPEKKRGGSEGFNLYVLENKIKLMQETINRLVQRIEVLERLNNVPIR